MEVFLIAAQTIDGFIARSTDDRSFDWTSPEDKKFYIRQIKQADAIVMGRKSFATFSKYPKDSRWIVYTSKPSEFKNPNPDVIQAEGTSEDPKKLIARLENEGCQTVAICGGASIYTQFLQAGVVDKLYLTVEPVVFGQGISLFSQPIKNIDLQLEEVTKLSGQTLLLTYQVFT